MSFMPRWMRYVFDACAQNVIPVVIGAGVLAMYAVLRTIWHKLVWEELTAVVCLFASGWLFAVVSWLQHKRPRARLEIIKAKYGLEDGRFKDVTLALRGHIKENKIDIPVLNDYLGGDPFQNMKKILVVTYSFGHSINKEIVRHETAQLVLPENSDRHIPMAFPVVHTPTLPAPEVAVAQKQEAASAGSADWKDLADRFEQLPHHVRAVWQCNRLNNQTLYEEWRFAGGATEPWETLCRYAGVLLMKSPNVLQHLSDSAKQQSNAAWRWLYFLKENHRALGYGDSHPPVDEQGTIYLMGSIENVSGKSALACIECAALEL